MSEDKKFYVYVHKYASGPKEGQVFYVGKGCRYRHSSSCGRNPHWENVANKYGFTPEIVVRFDNEFCAFSFEEHMIDFYGLENLVNISSGGEGASGAKWSDDKRLLFCKPVINSNGERFNSITEAASSYGGVKSISSICSATRGIQNTAYGATWAYEGHDLKPFVDPIVVKASSRGTTVHCSNGMVFYSFGEASRWVSRNGYPKATHEAIRKCALGHIGSAYGFTWSLDGECPEYIDRSKRISESRKKKVMCSNGMSFNSLLDAVKWIRGNGWPKATSSKVSLAANGKRRTAYGYKWEYIP